MAALQPVADQLKQAGGEGSAMGIAMKHLKSMDFKALGDDVKKAVLGIRS